MVATVAVVAKVADLTVIVTNEELNFSEIFIKNRGYIMLSSVFVYNLAPKKNYLELYVSLTSQTYI